MSRSPYESRVIVAGGRDFWEYPLARRYLDYFLQYLENIVIICGCAKGADTMGKLYAQEKGLRIRHYRPDWEAFGKRAGYLRNEDMLNDADMLIAFWDGTSKGTAHMIKIAKERGLQVRVIRYTGDKS